MTTLTSASTFAEVEAEYLDNADYAEAGSRTKALAFATACRYLLLLLPKRTEKGGPGGAATEYDPTVLERQLNTAQRYASASAAGGGYRHVDFSEFRD